MNVRKRGLALLMCICMIFTLLPFSALADTVAEYRGGGHGENKPSETVYKLYIGIYIPDNTSSTIDWPNEPCVSNKTYRYVQYGNSLGPLTDGSEPELGTWKVSYAADASQYINPTKDNFQNKYGATKGADGTLGVYNQGGIDSDLFKQDFLNDDMKTAIVNAYLAKQNKSNEDASNYQLVPYVLKFEKKSETLSEWHLDCVVLPNPSVTLSYDANLLEGASLPTGVGLPDNQTAKGNQATVNVKNMQYKDDYTGAKPVEVTANGKTYTFAGWAKTKDATTPEYDLKSLTNGSATITINSDTTLYAVWKEVTTYEVKYEYTGDIPTGAPNVPDVQPVTAGTAVTVAANPTLANYTFSGWKATDSSITATAGQKFTPTGDVTFQGQWTKNTVNYTVKYQWNGEDIDTDVWNYTGTASVGDSVKIIYKDIPGYTPKNGTAGGSFNHEIKVDNEVITINYYKDANVWAPTVEKKVGEDLGLVLPTQDVPQGSISYKMNGVPSNSNTVGEYPLTFTGDEIQGEYKVIYHPGKLTIYDIYAVTYRYEYTTGGVFDKLTAPNDARSPYMNDTLVQVLAAPTDKVDGYIFDGWYKDDTKIDAGATFTITSDTVIIGKWKPVTGRTCTINYIWNGNKATPIRTDTIYGLTYNEVVKKFPMDIPGYTPVSKDSQEIVVNTTGNVINFYYYKNVTLESNSGTFTYDGKDHSVSGYDVITKADNGKDVKVDAEFRDVSASRTEKGVGSYPVMFKFKGEAVDKQSLIGQVDSNEYYIVTAVNEGTLKIEKIMDEVTVNIKGNTKTVTYNGKEQQVEGYAADTNGLPITVKLANRTATAKGTEVGTYNMNLESTDFVATSDIYGNIKIVIVEDGWLKINPRTPVRPPVITDRITVTITGNSDSVVYDGTEHNVKGYTVKISDPRYTEKDFTFTGKAEASGVNAGTYETGLKAEQFKNTNARFTNVKFVIKADGVLTITPMDLTITAGSKDGIAPVTCNEYESTDLAKGDVIESVKITGEQLEPGQSPNVASDAVIKNAKGEDVTKNYNIKYVDGTLKAVEPLNKEDHFNYIVGYTDGTIRPNNNITRAEVAAIFFRLLTDEARSTFMTDDCSFSDVAQGAWCRRSIATLTNAEIISGYTDGTFKPNAPITRAELATIIARFAKLDVNTKTFSDINGHWAQKYIELAAGNGWIDGYTDGTFRPNQNIKRAETFAMINRVLDRVTESNSDLLPTDQMNMWSDNMDFDAWYYRDVQEATNNHKAERVGDSIYEKWTEKLPDIDWSAIQL